MLLRRWILQIHHLTGADDTALTIITGTNKYNPWIHPQNNCFQGPLCIASVELHWWGSGERLGRKKPGYFVPSISSLWDSFLSWLNFCLTSASWVPYSVKQSSARGPSILVVASIPEVQVPSCHQWNPECLHFLSDFLVSSLQDFPPLWNS